MFDDSWAFEKKKMTKPEKPRYDPPYPSPTSNADFHPKTFVQAALPRNVEREAHEHWMQEKEKSRADFAASILPYTDYYLGRPWRITNQQVAQIAHPCELVRAALCMHSQCRRGLRQPLPLSPMLPICEKEEGEKGLAQVKFWPVQLQHFLRGFVAVTALRLVTPAGDVYVDARTLSCWEECIFSRVMSGILGRVEVRLQGARCACV